ncbi:MAG: RNA polymerase subunit sigma, partial [Bacteroidetes bacterium]|nr:RNA polymerase subunit sigma [Bacteroidota bacterium]
NIPYYAKQNGAKVIEINPEKSNYTTQITDIFLQGKATEMMERLYHEIIQT